MTKKASTFRVTLQKLILDAKGPPTEIQILPFGNVQSSNGDFLFDEEAAEVLLEAFQQRQDDIVIDYEHQTLYGGEAPAAGWIKSLEFKGKEGLWAKVEWTSRGAEYVKGKEYRYLSPVVLIRKNDKRAVRLHSAALTNDPAIDGMEPIVAKAGIVDDENEEEIMEEFLKKLAAFLGLGEGATQDDVSKAVQGMAEKCRMAANKSLVADKSVLTLLGVGETATLDEVKGKIMSLKNPAGYVKTEDFEALKDQLVQKEHDDLVAQALSEGKISPAQKDWALEYVKTAPESFKKFVAMTAKGAAIPLKELGKGKEGQEQAAAADEVETMVNKAMGLSAEDLKKYGKKED